MINVAKNYGRLASCPVCRTKESDTQEHIFNCIILKLSSKLLYNMNNIDYSDIFSNNLPKLIQIAKIGEDILQKRKKILTTDDIPN